MPRSQEHILPAVLLLWPLLLSALLQSVQGGVISNEVGVARQRLRPGTKIGGLQATAADRLRFERLPCSCQMRECGCCATFQVQRFNISQRGCLNLSVDPNQFSMMMDVYLNNKSVYQQQVSGRNPPPICVPLPQFPLLMLCARLYDVHLEGNNVHVCVNLEAQLQGIPLLVVSFDCFRFGADGFGVEKPQLVGSIKDPTTYPTTVVTSDNVTTEAGE